MICAFINAPPLKILKAGPPATDFSLWGFAPATWATQAKINRKAHGLKFTLQASGKGRIEDQKTRTLEQHKGAAPKLKCAGVTPALQNRATAASISSHEHRHGHES